MKIDTTLLNLGGIEAGRTDASRTRAAATPAASPTQSDETTNVSSSVRTMAASLQAAPDVRTAKVASLQQAVASGQYQVNASALAQSMMRELM